LATALRPFLLLSLLWLLWPVAAATASPLRLSGQETSIVLGPHFALAVDPRAEWTIEQALQQPFEPLGPDPPMNFGYTRAALWLRLELQSTADQPTEWRLAFSYPSLDRVDLFDPEQPGLSLHAGDTLRFAERALPHRSAVFPLSLPAEGRRTVLLRVVSEGSLTLDASLWRAEAFAPHSEAGYTAHALYFGMLLALLVYNLLLYFGLRDRTFLYYVLFAGSFGVGLAGLSGFGPQFLWPDAVAWANRALPVGLVLAGWSALLFTRAFLDTARHLPRWDTALQGVIALQTGGLLLALFAPVQLAMQSMTLLSIVACSMMSLVGLRALLSGVPAAPLFALAWTLLLVGALVQGLRNLTLLPTNLLTLHGAQIGSALEMLLLSFALAARFSALRKAKERAQGEALAAHAAIVRTLQDQERVLEQRVEERTRALAEANRRLSTLALQDPLTGLPNRVALESQLERALAAARRRQGALALLMIDLDGFKPINDRHGHQTGDQVLVEIAGRLRACTRGSDLVARLGGDEFVMLTEQVAAPEAAHQLAERVLSALRRPLTVEGQALSIGASIGIAVSAAATDDATTLLRRADLAMYRAKHEGRDRYVDAAVLVQPDEPGHA
jgi:two-component system, sensor histidine kinase LadS